MRLSEVFDEADGIPSYDDADRGGDG